MGPGMEDYYNPSQPNMTKEEQDIERTTYKSVIATKLLSAFEGNEMKTMFTINMSINNDGYQMLRQMLEFYVPALMQPDDTQNYITMEKPRYEGCILSFHMRYCLWFNIEKQTKTFRTLDHISYYAQQMKADSRYAESVQRMIRECPLDIQTIPKQYALEKLCHTLIHRFRATNKNSLAIFKENYNGNGYRISAAEADKPMKKDGKQNRGKSQRRNTKREDVQCNKCKLYGHRASNCNIFGQVYWCLQYIKMHRDEATVSVNVYRDNNTPTAKAAHKASIKTAIEELLGTDTGDFLDNNEITKDQLYQLQNTLDNMDQGHINLTLYVL